MPALNYQAIYTAVLGNRFPAASQTPNAKRWIDTAYQDVWSSNDWTFRRVPLSSLTTTGTNQPTMPADYADTIELYDGFGARMERLDQERFERYYEAQLIGGTSGTPAAYMVVNRQIYLSTPTSQTLVHSYRRRLSHKNVSGSVVAGPMSVDTDFPLWDDHHSVLIPRARAIGLEELNDPTWQQAQMEYERQLERMKRDYVQVHSAYQWGRVGWDA